MIILVDMDDVLEPLLEYWVAALNRKGGTYIEPDYIARWDITSFFPHLSREEIMEPLMSSAIWDVIPPKAHSVEVLKKVVGCGHTVRIVTATHPDHVQDKVGWLTATYPFLTWKDVVIASDKSLIHGDIIIDDGAHNLERSPCRIKFLFDMPHNRHWNEEKHGATRVHSWVEIHEEMKKIGVM